MSTTEETTETSHGDVVNELQNVLGREVFLKVADQLREKLTYSPVIVFMGKTGAGKSSTCNKLFGEDLFKVSDVEVGTRAVQVEDHPNQITLVDVPGVGEGGENSRKYRALYETILKKGVTDKRTGKTKPVDAIVWLVKADDRALEIDKTFYDEVFSKLSSRADLDRLTFAISQCDAISPIRGEGSWDAGTSRPGPRQAANLDQKRRQIANMFGVDSNLVVDFSATEEFNLDKLLERVLFTLPASRKPIVVAQAEKAAVKARRAPRKTVSMKAEEEASEGLWDTVVDVVKELAPVLAPALKAIGRGVKKAWKALWSFFS